MTPWIVTLAGDVAELAAADLPGVRVLRELPPGRAVVLVADGDALARLLALDVVAAAVPDALEHPQR